jgi:hypothetical protein
MTNSPANKTPELDNSFHHYLRPAEDLVASGEKVLENTIVHNPGLALAISAALGVVFACLIKRR